jgi:hypothetical protein
MRLLWNNHYSIKKITVSPLSHFINEFCQCDDRPNRVDLSSDHISSQIGTVSQGKFALSETWTLIWLLTQFRMNRTNQRVITKQLFITQSRSHFQIESSESRDCNVEREWNLALWYCFSDFRVLFSCNETVFGVLRRNTREKSNDRLFLSERDLTAALVHFISTNSAKRHRDLCIQGTNAILFHSSSVLSTHQKRVWIPCQPVVISRIRMQLSSLRQPITPKIRSHIDTNSMLMSRSDVWRINVLVCTTLPKFLINKATYRYCIWHSVAIGVVWKSWWYGW